MPGPLGFGSARSSPDWHRPARLALARPGSAPGSASPGSAGATMGHNPPVISAHPTLSTQNMPTTDPTTHPTSSAVFVDSSAKNITFHENYAGEKLQVSGKITLVRKLKLAQVWGSVGLSGDRSGPPGAFSARLELAKLGLPRLGLAWCSLARFRQAWLCSPRLSLPDPRCIFSFIYAGLSTVFWTLSYIPECFR